MRNSFEAFQAVCDAKWRRMNGRGAVSVIMLLAMAALLAGCHGDPNVRKQKYLESGERYSAQGKYREAVIQFSNALKVDKNYADAHYALARHTSIWVNITQLIAELLRTVDLQPTNYKARIDLGNLLIAGGRIDEAQMQANAVMAAQPNNPDVHALLSAIAVRRGQKDQAMIEMQRALELDPNRAVFHEDLALLQADPTKAASVEDELKKAVALDPKSVNAKLLLAAFYVKNNHLADAEKIGWEAVATDPKSLAARASVAQIILKEGDQARAEEVLRQASKDFAADPQGVRILADYYVNSGQIDKAKAEFSSLAAKYPENVSVQKGYIRVLLEVKDYETAQTVVARLMKTHPKDPEVAGLNGIVLLNSGKASDAVTALENAVKDCTEGRFPAVLAGQGCVSERQY